ncbi:MAG: EAL and modified HD-GYP domain-containing signal transduction protein, partial [Candidatus Azotimanducaceae bacterium]
MKAEIVVNEDTLPGVQVVRQPIYDKSLKVVAYNLLYRSSPETASLLFDKSALAIRFLLDEYASVHESGMLRELPAVIEVPPGSIRGDWNLGEDAQRVILNIVSPDDIDIRTIQNIEKASVSGHQIL